MALQHVGDFMPLGEKAGAMQSALHIHIWRERIKAAAAKPLSALDYIGAACYQKYMMSICASQQAGLFAFLLATVAIYSRIGIGFARDSHAIHAKVDGSAATVRAVC